ncbi:LptE family protein [Polluticaenibacter yanchengensis]|uniref:LptE family protein n=1 Tax=Polluticaenibacter yanchengensis TaxID=3014562 RepID=A0ABT4UHT0_9BACT|nr:LptE family protein [Chitinophagaceae bacterium LY-5]
MLASLHRRQSVLMILIGLVTIFLSGCKIYTFKDISIPAEIKTVKLRLIENRARYINPLLAPTLTNRLQEKIVGQTKLNRVEGDDADWLITGTITDYSVTTSGIANQAASLNQLNVTVQIKLKDNVNQKEEEYSVNKMFSFAASLSLDQAEASLNEEIIKGLTDEVFNRLFSNW